MDELAEGALKGILRFLGLIIRALIWLTYEFLFEKVAWYIGWPICRLITFNSLPREGITESERASGTTQLMVSMTGLLSLVASGALIAQLTGSVL
ncbi:hypothetical protein SAMN03159511_0420 [Pseudomonas sp. NFACC19-2]|nr:hypothetical protein [Pseudomonas sp. NFACC19-2]SFW62834.1 hypothetical protein SAMN03159511_0420 [Pseudomonas sp. NFACC19-2]